jgi:hypothetical protein
MPTTALMVASFSPSHPAMRERMSTPGPPLRGESTTGVTARTVDRGMPESLGDGVRRGFGSDAAPPPTSWRADTLRLGAEGVSDVAGGIPLVPLLDAAMGRGRRGAVGPSCVQLYAAICSPVHSSSCKYAEFLTAPASSQSAGRRPSPPVGSTLQAIFGDLSSGTLLQLRAGLPPRQTLAHPAHSVQVTPG